MRRPDPAPGRSRLLVFPRSGCEAGTHQISLCKSLKSSESSLVIPAGTVTCDLRHGGGGGGSEAPQSDQCQTPEEEGPGQKRVPQQQKKRGLWLQNIWSRG